MKRSDIKYRVLAGLCVLLTIPIIGYVQKQAAVTPPRLKDDRTLPREEQHRWQRHELHDWLLRNTKASAVMVSGSNRRVIEVALGPESTPEQLIGQARQVRQVMTMYFREGSDGAVTAVILRANQGRSVVSVRTGLLDTPTQRDTSWHIMTGSKILN